MNINGSERGRRVIKVRGLGKLGRRDRGQRNNLERGGAIKGAKVISARAPRPTAPNELANCAKSNGCIVPSAQHYNAGPIDRPISARLLGNFLSIDPLLLLAPGIYLGKLERT